MEDILKGVTKPCFAHVVSGLNASQPANVAVKPHCWIILIVNAVANPLGAWVEASVARVRRSMKMGDVVIQPNLDPGADVLEKVYPL